MNSPEAVDRPDAPIVCIWKNENGRRGAVSLPDENDRMLTKKLVAGNCPGPDFSMNPCHSTDRESLVLIASAAVYAGGRLNPAALTLKEKPHACHTFPEADIAFGLTVLKPFANDWPMLRRYR